jgi:hypothetical protein
LNKKCYNLYNKQKVDQHFYVFVKFEENEMIFEVLYNKETVMNPWKHSTSDNTFVS